MSPEITFCLEKLQFQRLLFCLIISLVNYPEQLLRAFYFSHQSSFSFPNAWKIILHSTPKQNNGSEHPQNPLSPPSLKTNMHIHPYFLPVCQERNVFERPVPLTVFLILTLSTQRTLFHQLSPSSSVSYSLSLLAPSTPQCPALSHPFLSLSAAPFQLRMFRESPVVTGSIYATPVLCKSSSIVPSFYSFCETGLV